MEFNINMNDMSNAIASFDSIYTGMKADLEKTEKAISSLCEQGWSGESKEEYLKKVVSWSVEMRKVLNQIQELKSCLENNIDDADSLLIRGKRLSI